MSNHELDPLKSHYIPFIIPHVQSFIKFQLLNFQLHIPFPRTGTPPSAHVRRRTSRRSRAPGGALPLGALQLAAHVLAHGGPTHLPEAFQRRGLPPMPRCGGGGASGGPAVEKSARVGVVGWWGLGLGLGG